jgi:hypothetical protein
VNGAIAAIDADQADSGQSPSQYRSGRRLPLELPEMPRSLKSAPGSMLAYRSISARPQNRSQVAALSPGSR